MNQSQKRAWLQRELRKISIKWRERGVALGRARVEREVGMFKNGKTKKKVLFKCAKCRDAFDRKEVQVDHIIPIGIFKDWNHYIDALFCSSSNLQVLCAPCHKQKTRESGT